MYRLVVLFIMVFSLVCISVAQASSGADRINGTWEIDWQKTIEILKKNGMIPEGTNPDEVLDDLFDRDQDSITFDTKNKLLHTSDDYENVQYSVISSKDDTVIFKADGERFELFLYKEKGNQYMRFSMIGSEAVIILRPK